MNERGRVKLSTVVTLLILGVALYCGFAFGGVYWRRMQLEDIVRQQISFAGQLTDDAIRQRIVGEIAGLNLPPEASRVRLQRTAGPRSLRVRISYSEAVNLLFVTKEMPINVDVRRRF